MEIIYKWDDFISSWQCLFVSLLLILLLVFEFFLLPCCFIIYNDKIPNDGRFQSTFWTYSFQRSFVQISFDELQFSVILTNWKTLLDWNFFILCMKNLVWFSLIFDTSTRYMEKSEKKNQNRIYEANKHIAWNSYNMYE